MFGIATMLASAGMDLVSKFVDTGKDEAVKLLKEKTGIDLTNKTTLNENEVEKLKQFENENKQMLLKEIELYNQDRANARNMSIELSKSDSWLLKNTGSLLAIFVTLSTFVIFALLLVGKLSIDNPNVALICGFIGGYVTSILSFYFGASKTEADVKRIKR